ncbi:MAG: RnfABCDGE type electron transport complex subunit D [candidate division WOR-3 bacterium]
MLPDDNLIVVSSPPHIHSGLSIKKAVFIVILCLIPAVVVGTMVYGFYALSVVLISVISAMLFEQCFEYWHKQGRFITDGTAALTGLLLGLSLPPAIPLWIPAIGGGFAVIIAKHALGGLGFNHLNPALTARAFLMLSFPQIMITSYKSPFHGTLLGLDTITTATPLTLLKNTGYYGTPTGVLEQLHSPEMFKLLFLGNIGGSIGETCKIALIAGGATLLILRIIDYRIVTGYMVSFCLINLVLPGRINLLFQLFTGGLLLGVFFMATDWVTSPITPEGRWLFGIGCGLFTALFRYTLEYPEGVTPAILLMNLSVPLLDKIVVWKRSKKWQRN